MSAVAAHDLAEGARLVAEKEEARSKARAVRKAAREGMDATSEVMVKKNQGWDTLWGLRVKAEEESARMLEEEDEEEAEYHDFLTQVCGGGGAGACRDRGQVWEEGGICAAGANMPPPPCVSWFRTSWRFKSVSRRRRRRYV